MSDVATLRVLFGGTTPTDILDALTSLRQKGDGVTVQIQQAGPIEPENIPMPLAEFKGKSRVHEYGHDAVLALIQDVKDGRVE